MQPLRLPRLQPLLRHPLRFQHLHLPQRLPLHQPLRRLLVAPRSR
jgi:hypothetical protein